MNYKRLEELLDYEQPNDYIVEDTKYNDKYKIPVLTAGQSFILGYTNEENNIFKAEANPVIIFDDFTTSSKYVDFDFKVKSSAMKILKAKDGVNIKYVYYLMQTIKFDNQLHKRYWISAYSKIKVPMPNIEIQNEIVEKLDLITKIIYDKKEQLQTLNQLIKSQFVEMFGDIKNDDFDNSQIKDLVDTNIIKTKKKFKKNDVIKYIDISSINNIKNEIIGFTEYKIGEEPSRAQQCLVKGDILISTVRPNLKNIAVNYYNDENIIGSSGFCVLRPNKCELEYLLSVVKSEKFTNDMVAKTTGANYPAIHSTDILNYEIAVPPIELQNQFADIVKQIDKQKFEIENSLKEMQELYESLMEKYFG